MSTVYVRWYGNVLQGEIVEKREEGLLAGMVAVRIPIQGMHATALFTPGHVYMSAAEAAQKECDPAYAKHKTFELTVSGNIPQIFQNSPNIFGKTSNISENQREISRSGQKVSISDIMPEDDRRMIEDFKRDNWDHERGHLRIDKLDEFYSLWREVMRPSGHSERQTPTVAPKKPAAAITCPSPAITRPYCAITRPYQTDTKQKKQKKQNIVQLSLFD